MFWFSKKVFITIDTYSVGEGRKFSNRIVQTSLVRLFLLLCASIDSTSYEFSLSLSLSLLTYEPCQILKTKILYRFASKEHQLFLQYLLVYDIPRGIPDGKDVNKKRNATESRYAQFGEG